MSATFDEVVLARQGVRIPQGAANGLIATSDAVGNVVWNTIATATGGGGPLLKNNDLSDVQDVPTSRANLGVPPITRAISAGAGLTGGGDLSVDRTLAVSFGSASGTAAQGNDIRFIAATVLNSDMAAISNQTALQNITGLGLSIGASATEIWRVSWWLLVNAANATMDLKLGFTIPTACTMKGGVHTGSGVSGLAGWAAVAVGSAPPAIAIQTDVIAVGTIAGTIGIELSYLVFGGGTAGIVQPQYAQNTADAGNLQVLKGSYIEARKLAT